MKKSLKKEFPKKAKLISDGGLYRIVDIDKFIPVINLPITRNVVISTPEIFHQEMMKFNLRFRFDRVRGGYAEYRQSDFIKMDSL